ncbi:Ricin-type beta-trefoil lectin domain-like [Streptomyces sp. OK228]|nr:Ricin-type beta-trefoil lectin domain-like [Streptomyces sp. OK228]
MRAIQGAVAAGLALGGVAVATGTAAAGVGVNTDHWQVEHDYWIGPNDNTNRCVDDSIDPNSKDGNLLRGFPCYQNSYSGGWQKWHVISVDPNGYAQLKNMSTGLCLDDSNGGPNGTELLRGYSCNGGSYDGGWQKWKIVNRNTGTSPSYYQQVLQNANTGRCLDDSDAGNGGSDLLRGYPCNGGSQDGGWQGWYIYDMGA